MPGKDFQLEGGLAVTVYKRRTNRHLRLTIGPSGEVRVSIPAWAPYKAGLAFARSRYDWIMSRRPSTALLADGQAVGKAHRLAFVPSKDSKLSSRLSGGTVTIRYPSNMTPASPAVQEMARKACFRALKAQANQLLPQRLAGLADAHGFEYGRVSVKRLKSRWGSCDHAGNIVLNLFLMQLPWDLIDYVLLHELAHTKVLRHGPDFWQEMARVLPDAKQRRKRLKDFQPILDS
jgi:predicted metal-dependent hydrolase